MADSIGWFRELDFGESLHFGVRSMAVSGGRRRRMWCQVHGWQLTCQPTARLRTECATVDHALQILARGERCVVAGSDMAALRMRLQQVGVQ